MSGLLAKKGALNNAIVLLNLSHLLFTSCLARATGDNGGDGAAAAGGVEENGGEYCMPVQTSRGSPTFSVKSWDSHTHYQEFKEPEDDDPDNFFPSRPMQSIVCYCDISTFKTPRTLLRVLLVVRNIYRNINVDL